MMDTMQVIDNLFNGREPKVIRVRLSEAQIEKLKNGGTLEFKAGKNTLLLFKK